MQQTRFCENCNHVRPKEMKEPCPNCQSKRYFWGYLYSHEPREVGRFFGMVLLVPRFSDIRIVKMTRPESTWKASHELLLEKQAKD